MRRTYDRCATSGCKLPYSHDVHKTYANMRVNNRWVWSHYFVCDNCREHLDSHKGKKVIHNCTLVVLTNGGIKEVDIEISSVVKDQNDGNKNGSKVLNA